jgi:hypothetical protein
MLSLARRAIAAFHSSARCRVNMPGTKLRPKADSEQIRKVGDLLRTHAGIDVCTHSLSWLPALGCWLFPVLGIATINDSFFQTGLHLISFFRKCHGHW